jgi:hypothetical protein
MLNLLPASAAFLLGLLFDPEDGGDMLLRNIGLAPNYTMLQLRKPYTSASPLWEPQIQRKLEYEILVLQLEEMHGPHVAPEPMFPTNTVVEPRIKLFKSCVKETIRNLQH